MRFHGDRDFVRLATVKGDADKAISRRHRLWLVRVAEIESWPNERRRSTTASPASDSSQIEAFHDRRAYPAMIAGGCGYHEKFVRGLPANRYHEGESRCATASPRSRFIARLRCDWLQKGLKSRSCRTRPQRRSPGSGKVDDQALGDTFLEPSSRRL